MREIRSQQSSSRHRHAKSHANIRVAASIAERRHAKRASRVDEHSRRQTQRAHDRFGPISPFDAGMGQPLAEHAANDAVVQKRMGSQEHLPPLASTGTRL